MISSGEKIREFPHYLLILYQFNSEDMNDESVLG